MLDLFKKVTYLYNLRNSFLCASYKILTVRYVTETIIYLWSVVLDKIKEFAAIKTFRQKNQVMKTRYMLHLERIHCKCWFC